MNKILTAFAGLLLLSVSGWAQRIPAEALGPFSYDIRYTWGAIDAKVATATISLESGNWQDKPAYHASAFVKTSAIFRLFIGADLKVDGYLARSDRQPFYTINPFRKNGKDGKFEYTYDRGTRKITVRREGPKDNAENVYPYDEKTFDLLSLLTFFRFVKTPDKPISLKVILGDAAHAATLNYLDKDTETFPGEETERFRLRLTDRGVMENGSGNELTIWRSTGADHKILGVEAPINPGHMSIRPAK